MVVQALTGNMSSSSPPSSDKVVEVTHIEEKLDTTNSEASEVADNEKTTEQSTLQNYYNGSSESSAKLNRENSKKDGLNPLSKFPVGLELLPEQRYVICRRLILVSQITYN